MAETTLGRFGDRRLEKGGPFFMPGLWRQAGVDCGFGVWAVIGRGRSV